MTQVMMLTPALLQETQGVFVVPAGHVLHISDREHTIADATIECRVQRDAQCLYEVSVRAESATVKRVIRMICAEPGATATVRAVLCTSNAAQGIIETVQEHLASHTQSSVIVHGVSADVSRGQVHSTIAIAADVSGIAADQVHKHLLLDEGAKVVSVPALDVLSHDVSCSHGSAIAPLDPLLLFYLATRGLNTAQSRASAIDAFLST